MTFGAAAPLVLASLSGGDLFRMALAALFAFVLLKVGMNVLGGFARPVPAHARSG